MMAHCLRCWPSFKNNNGSSIRVCLGGGGVSNVTSPGHNYDNSPLRMGTERRHIPALNYLNSLLSTHSRFNRRCLIYSGFFLISTLGTTF